MPEKTIDNKDRERELILLGLNEKIELNKD